MGETRIKFSNSNYIRNLIYDIAIYFKLETLICVRIARLMRMKKLNLYKLDVGSVGKKAPESIDASEKDVRISAENGDEPVAIANEQSEEKIRVNRELRFKFAAIVIDRLFLVVSSLYAIVTFISLVIIIPDTYKS